CRASDLAQGNLELRLELRRVRDVLPRAAAAALDDRTRRRTADPVAGRVRGFDRLDHSRPRAVAPQLGQPGANPLAWESPVEEDDPAVSGARERVRAIGQPFNAQLELAGLRRARTTCRPGGTAHAAVGQVQLSGRQAPRGRGSRLCPFTITLSARPASD